MSSLLVCFLSLSPGSLSLGENQLTSPETVLWRERLMGQGTSARQQPYKRAWKLISPSSQAFRSVCSAYQQFECNLMRDFDPQVPS